MRQAANISTVPKRSVFRYPGGKTWLVPEIRRWLSLRAGKTTHLVEPFAGGAIASLTAVMEGLVSGATILDLDRQVASVWGVVLGGDGLTLAEAIRDFDFNEKNVLEVLNSKPGNVIGRAFQTILRNRVRRNGILAAGAGILKSGESGCGLASRWYPGTLAERILEISAHRKLITFRRYEGLSYLSKHSSERGRVYFIDPPYNGTAERLYEHSRIDSARLFDVADGLAGDFLMTYSPSLEITELARKHDFQIEPIQMNSHGKVEFLVGRDLSWLEPANDNPDCVPPDSSVSIRSRQ